MKRRAFAATAIAGLAAPLTACSGSEDEGGDGGPVNLVVWESLEGRSDFIKQAGEIYAKDHPNVTIEYKNVELGDALGQIALDGPAGVGADVFAAPSNVTGDLVTGGHILAVADPDALKSALVESAIKSVTYQDQIWGVPVTLDTYALFYNKAYVTEVPTTWDEVIAFSTTFNAENSGKYGFAFNPSIYYAAPFVFSAPDNLLFGPNGDDPATPNTDTPAAVQGLTEMLALRAVLDVAANDLDPATVDTLFESGQAAMTLTGSWNIPVFTDAGIDFGVTTLPARAGTDQPSGSFANSRTMFVSAYTNHPEEAQDFAAFLSSPEMLRLAYELTGSVPPADTEIDSEATLGLVE
ncbi:extracellular solute-binding protein [Glycomyces albidus]|uniref:extracellular solute-binding protein n=1 Tax=Glycomyces albidus TaxID=2656774 RepID=UPI00128FDD57|nr:extracellular solute-binding protein [Glycomyces albidus]